MLFVGVSTIEDAQQLALCSDIAPLQVVLASQPAQPETDIDLGNGPRVHDWRESDIVLGGGGSINIDTDTPMALPTESSPPPLQPPPPPPPPLTANDVAVDPVDDEKARQLLAQMSRNGVVCERVLAPRKVHDLSVWIAIPEPGEGGIVWPEGAFEDFGADGVADLVVDVTSADGTFHASAPLKLSEDRRRPSTVAAFKVKAGAEGSAMQLNITVLYDNRPIFACELIADVRATALPKDRVQLWQVPLSLNAPIG